MKLHEQTQRLILLLMFYLLGPMLTLGIIGGVVLRKLPFHARSWERSLTQQTGLHWVIQSVEYRSPGFVRLHEVKILDDTAQHPLFHAQQIDVRRVTNIQREKVFPGIPVSFNINTSSPWEKITGLFENSFSLFHSTDQFWQITATHSILNFGKYSSEESALLVQNTLRKVFARLDSLSEVPVQLVLEQMAVISEHSLKKEGDNIEDKFDFFRFIHGNIYRTAAEIRSDWAFQIREVSEVDVNSLSFIHSFTNTTNISFRTGKQPIPCDLAAVFCSLFSHFSGGSFKGEFVLSTQNGQTNSSTIRLNNVIFNNVPLVPLVRPYTDFAVTGTVADLQLHQAVFGTDGTYAVGCLLVVDGAIESALFHRCVDHFDLTVEPQELRDSPMQMIPFSGCSIHFCLQPEGIDFWADEKWGNALIHRAPNLDGTGMITVRFPNHRRPVTYHELMSIFVADSAPVVPLTSGMKTLLPVIPIQ